MFQTLYNNYETSLQLTESPFYMINIISQNITVIGVINIVSAYTIPMSEHYTKHSSGFLFRIQRHDLVKVNIVP